LLSTYCCGWSLEDFLLKGFKGAYGKVESTPPKHFDTALDSWLMLSTLFKEKQQAPRQFQASTLI
jgi:anaerobic ribonucleoside-triphosphate reductase